ncbi:zinc phosphodiesterase ELAC 2-like isoform X2 [Chlorella sorokiniana]|uniref:ribonuclease Z n=1 Tax=Chlorella sorokiniana TaxID=3076 RepID=A0A2P6TLP6_CHLSO|nr:zinc phosphodiesterase ELAC 2-like isoform X2 [Chlorella sorokiniana]|eukprot:PRW45195.1 zinc phosphodiesterase ELAC 2-like isoform X2 [Chlorella sorokiniana]
MVSLAAQRFIAQVLEEAHNTHKLRQMAPAAKLKEQGFDPKDKRDMLSVEDLVKALGEHGVKLGRAPYYTTAKPHSMQAHVVTAAGDGVAPAVLLSLPASGGLTAAAAAAAAAARQPPAQYLFNVPEGFARLVLEHKLRPGAGLRAAFAPEPAALSGFGGLVMRLRGEGHSQLHVVGPPGTQAAVCSLRHFIHWRHPAVVLEEASHWEAPLLYQDDRIAVAALWKPPLVAGMWPAPGWLQQAQPSDPSEPGAMEAGSSDGSSSSSSEESSSNQLLLLTNLHSRAAATQLQQHPALALLAQQPERVAAVLHLAAPGVAGSRALRQLCQQLRPAVQGPAAGQQLLLEQPGAHGSGQAIGHLASARTTAKLNLVSSRLFPLPAGVPLASGNAHGSGSSGPEVLFLGTGSAEPSKYRGASAIQLRLSCGQSLLMDCGEGTLGALCRAHGTAAALRHVASLGCLWVSHRHADHMSGVLPLLAAYPASLPPLLVVGPRSLRDWLAEAAAPLGLAGRYLFVHCAELNQPGHWARHALQRHLGVCGIQCVPVRHCSDAYGLVLKHEEGWSLVYSGDTQPCQQLVQAGRGCSLLIHEATFEPCLESQARAKRHSTTAEALEIAQRMGAYRCILTHFSQRYPKWPEGLPLAADAPPTASASEQRTENGSTDAAGAAAVPAAAAAGATAAVAFDGMRVPLALLPVLPALMPAVQAALADVEEEEEKEEEQQEQQEREQQQVASGGDGDDSTPSAV